MTIDRGLPREHTVGGTAVGCDIRRGNNWKQRFPAPTATVNSDKRRRVFRCFFCVSVVCNAPHRCLGAPGGTPRDPQDPPTPGRSIRDGGGTWVCTHSERSGWVVHGPPADPPVHPYTHSEPSGWTENGRWDLCPAAAPSRLQMCQRRVAAASPPLVAAAAPPAGGNEAAGGAEAAKGAVWRGDATAEDIPFSELPPMPDPDPSRGAPGQGAL
eukprot:gene12529-biopygen14024